MGKVPVTATSSKATVVLTVSSDAGGEGAAVSNESNSVGLDLINTGLYDVEYKVDSGDWVTLPYKARTHLDANLADITLTTRKSASALGNGQITMLVESITREFSAGDTAMILGASVPVNEQTDSYTLVLSDAGKQIDMNKAEATTLTVPPAADEPFEVGTVIWVCMKGAGVPTITAGDGVTLEKPAAKSLAISAQFEMARLHKVATDTWRVNAD